MTLKRRVAALTGAVLLTGSLVACGSGGETDDGNSGEGTPTAEPTADDGDSDQEDGSGGSGDGSG